MNKIIHLAFLFFASSVHAETLRGQVIKVYDGDTMIVQTLDQKVRVRLSDIDAPEKKQAFGQESTDSLSQMCLWKPVTVHVKEKDRYRRSIGRVKCGKHDANREQVRKGLAWAYTAYTDDQDIINLERQAKRANFGLFSDPNSIRPSEFRKNSIK